MKLADCFTCSRLVLYIPITLAAYLDAKHWVLNKKNLDAKSVFE